MTAVQASELQKNFGEWNDRVHDGPIEITKYGRTVSFLVSAKLFHEMWACYRKALPVEALSQADMLQIAKAQVVTDAPYSLSDLPEIDEPSPSTDR